MTELEIKTWLIEWFHNSSSVEIEKIAKMDCDNYFTVGLVDSFGFISLLSDIEEKFGTTFSNNDFLDRSFSTIDGLSKMIMQKI